MNKNENNITIMNIIKVEKIFLNFKNLKHFYFKYIISRMLIFRF